MGWRDTVSKFFRRQSAGQVAELARGASGEASMPNSMPSTPDSGMSGAYMQLATMLSVDNDLMLRFADYENMDESEVISAALDIYADDATVADTVHGKVIWGVSKDKVVRDIINDLLDRRIKIEDDIWTAIRTFVKYGNIFCEIIVNEKGVLGLNWLPPPTVRRIVDMRGNLLGFVQDPTGAFSFQLSNKEDLDRLKTAEGLNGAVFFEPWQVIHWRMRGKQMRALYGFSLLDSVRWVWKRLLMLEDSSLVCKLSKAPARFAFYIDTGEIPPREARAMVDDVRRRYKKKKIIDPSTGKVDFRFNPLEQSEDFFIPARAGKDATRVEVLSGPDYDDTGVLEYFRKKLYGGLRIPPQYLGGTEVTNRAALCLAGDTPIPLLDGTEPTIAELSKRTEPFWVYSVDAVGNVVPGRGSSARVTRRQAQTVEVVLDNGEVLTCTPDHPVMLRDGSYLEARELCPGTSVMPLYRRDSGFKTRDKLNGYEMVRNPRTDRWEYTHRLVLQGAGVDVKHGSVRHHVNFDKRDNRPENIVVMEADDHLQLHRDHADKILLLPEVQERRKQAQSQWLASERGRSTILKNCEAMRSPTSRFWDWLHSDEHRKLKSMQMREQWNSGTMRQSHGDEWRVRMSEVMQERIANGTAPDTRRERNPRWRADATLEHLIETAHSYHCTNRKQLIQWSGYSECLIRRVLAQHDISYMEFAAVHLCSTVKPANDVAINHRVVTVRPGPVIDTYDLTVDKYHNFAVGQGIFVHNSQEDVQFSRLEMRIQREFVGGLNQVVRVHLAALNIDPDSVKWALRMPAPSSIFEMQQVEVWNARAALAAALQPFFTNPWIMANIFHLSDEDALFASEAKQHETEQQALAQAQVQADVMQRFPELGPEGALALGAPSGMGGQDMGPGGMEDVKRRVDKALTEMKESNERVLQAVRNTDATVLQVGRRLRAVPASKSNYRAREER